MTFDVCILRYIIFMLGRAIYYFFFFKQKTAYEMRISDWSSDVCSSDLYGYPVILSFCISESNEAKSNVLPFAASGTTRAQVSADTRKIGRASCRERVCQYV